MSAGPFDFRISPATIRAAGRVVTDGAEAWLSNLAGASGNDTSTFGSDSFAATVKAFHTETHGRSMDYYGEVGLAGVDVGTGMAWMADLYEEVEAEAVSRAAALAEVVRITAEVGLL